MSNITVMAMSDMHGHLPPPSTLLANKIMGDIAVIAGDIVPATMTFHAGTKDGLINQVHWIRDVFIPWTQELPVDHVVVTPGNHDWFADQIDGSVIPDSWWPKNVSFLINAGITIEGINFYGIPQTPRFYDWAFNVEDTKEELGTYWKSVPIGTHVLVTHGPPDGACDTTFQGGKRRKCGSKTQRDWLESDAPNQPKVVICGHIHGSGGKSAQVKDTTVYNVSIVNEKYRPERLPRLITIHNDSSHIPGFDDAA